MVIFMVDNKHISFVCWPDALQIGNDNEEARGTLAVIRRNYARVTIVEIQGMDDLYSIVRLRPDLVFLGASRTHLVLRESTNPKEVWLSEFFEAQGIAHSGSSAASMRLGADKAEAKRVIRRAGLKTAHDIRIDENGAIISSQRPGMFPLFVKPSDLGNGKGIGPDSVVYDEHALRQKTLSIRRDFNTTVIAETYLTGREFTIAVLEQGGTDTPQAMPLELIAESNMNGDRIVSGSIKQADSEKVIGVRDAVLHAQLSEFAVAAFRALSGRDYGRIDVRMDAEGEIHFLEANLRPGLGGGYFKRAAWLNGRMTYAVLIERILQLGLNRAATVTQVTA